MKWDKVFPDVPESFHNRVLDTLDSQIYQAERRSKPVKTTKRFIAVIAAVMLLLSLSIVAYALGLWNPRLAEIFGVNEEQQQTLLEDGTTTIIGASASDNGLTIEVVQMIADKNGLFMLLNVTAPDGISLSAESSFERVRSSIDGFENYNSSGGFPSDGNQSNANQWYYEMWIFKNEAEDLNGKEITLSFTNLEAEQGKLDFYTALEGNWELSWVLEYQDHTQVYEPNESINLGGFDLIVDSFEISPISMSVTLSGEQVSELAEAMNISADIPAFITPCFILNDGTQFVARGGLGSYGLDSSGTKYVITSGFDKVLDIKNVTVLQLNYSYDGEMDMAYIPIG